MWKCVVIGEMKFKKELVCVVCLKEGDVLVDVMGKKFGCGVYVSKDKEVILLVKKKNVFLIYLGVLIDEVVYEELLVFVEKEK